MNRKVTIVPTMNLDQGDAAELAELLQFLRDWLASNNADLQAALETFVGSAGYDLGQLGADLDRFTFLLGGNDGEPLFQPEPR
jgi:hypothetical protein